jgi:hypothetical protein
MIDPAEALALATIQDPAAREIREWSALFAAVRDARKARGYTARGALVLAYVAPILLTKPRPGARHAPEGYVEITIAHHLLPECDGTWWVPDAAVPEALWHGTRIDRIGNVPCDRKCGACHGGRCADCSGWCFCSCQVRPVHPSTT